MIHYVSTDLAYKRDSITQDLIDESVQFRLTLYKMNWCWSRIAIAFQSSHVPEFQVTLLSCANIGFIGQFEEPILCPIHALYSHGHFWFVKNQFFWNFCFSVKDAEKFIKHHLFIYKRFTTDQNFKGVTQKLRLPRPWQVQNWPNYTMPFYYVKVPK